MAQMKLRNMDRLRAWRKAQFEAGNPYSVDDFYRMADAAPALLTALKEAVIGPMGDDFEARAKAIIAQAEGR